MFGAAVAVAMVLCWGVSLAWWLLLPSARVVSIEVPRGTAAAITRGESPTVIPSTLLLRRGDTLAVRNDDEALHRIGLLAIAPGTTGRLVVDANLLDGPNLLCTFHASGAIGISALARPGIEVTIIPTLIAGIPVSIALCAAIWVIRRLDAEPA